MTVTAERAFKIGRVLGWYFGANMGKKCRAVIGKDTRRSSYTLEYAIAAGITASGGDAYILHVTTTPSVSFVTRREGFDCGVMISASHNPFYDNGIKLLNSQGEKLSGGVISLIERYLDGDLTPFGGGINAGENAGENTGENANSCGDIPFASGKDIGRTVDYVSGRNRYVGHLISLSTCSYKGLKIGLDGANGSAFAIAPNVFEALGAKTFCIGVEPDGTNVNGGVGSTHISALCKAVVENGLDIGFAFDGDADRCIAADGRGDVLTGDEIMYICANFLKKRGELSGGKIVCTVLSNGGLISSLARRGITCEVCDVGDKNVWAKMCECRAALGGERSGHVVFSKYETTGDGLVTAIMLMEAVISAGLPVRELLKGYKPLLQTERNVPCPDKGVRAQRAARVSIIAERLSRERGVRVVLRPSGTESVIRVMCEGAERGVIEEVAEELERELLK